jgi:hypothetical protein
MGQFGAGYGDKDALCYCEDKVKEVGYVTVLYPAPRESFQSNSCL